MSGTDLAKDLKNVSEKDRKQIEQAQEMMGPDPDTMGFMKNLFWGNFREDLVFPYPEVAADEAARCDQLLAALDAYLTNEHPAIQIDRDQEVPDWCIKRLFEIGVLGMTIPAEFGGLGLGITSYNRVLERIGRSCGSTAVVVSAHQSIGCKAVMLFGTDEQKSRFLPRLAADTLSAFCLSEPNVGCDAGGQETRCEVSEDGEHFILNGEKKWATSGALSGLFTVMAKQRITDPKTGKTKDKVTALICTPDMEGVDIFSRNRSKCGIRGTWQARIRLKDVKVPRSNLLHAEGRGLNVALTCLNYGRCTLSAGMVGAARFSLEQGAKWAKNRYQFDRPLAEFELVQDKLADMAAYVYAMDAMLYMTTGFLDRHDEDIMLETAMCKVFCSEYGYQTVNHCLQIMGGESYMTENRIERMWRDSRINTIVEGANEVMHSFVFAYGSKQLGEWMLSVKNNPTRNIGA
ncbi:MAG: acyl-CoA dehydrogenase, partial [Phycisphaera sp.]|nr:acyl-CoA dehydrogenase [Phycisphaera sp.]